MKRVQTICAAMLLGSTLALVGCAALAPLLGIASVPVPVTTEGQDGKPTQTTQPLWYALIALVVREIIPVKTAGAAAHQRLRKPKAA